MATPTRYSVGDKVWITAKSFLIMKSANANRCRGMPWLSDEFLAKCKPLVGITGTVTHTFPPGYEVTVKIGDQSFHMKDHYIEPRPDGGHWLDAEIERQALHYGMSREAKAELFDGAIRHEQDNPYLD